MTWNFCASMSDYPLVEDGDEQAARRRCHPPGRQAAARRAPVATCCPSVRVSDTDFAHLRR
ncbi:hypothetical protein [Paractinoplanes brasiliensis]|uniref:hypothetical protein n=1 Tax=Paractinoplanes brasiliensis TaxID=52695 RepID=UPI001062323C|nr:hypothetical protein [Actinoplanes brasiliensis]